MRVQLLLLVMFGMQCLLHGMVSVENTGNKNILWDVIIKNSLCSDDYDKHRQFASVSKLHNEIIEDTYRSHKKCIERSIKEKNAPVTGYRSWNKDFSTCAWVTFLDDHSSNPRDVQFTLVGVVNKEIVEKSALWQEFYFPIFEDNVRPFFDQDGRACFYGFGKIPTSYDIFNIVQYCIDLIAYSQRYSCRFQYCCALPDDVGFYDVIDDLKWLLPYPVLLKAFLQSKLVKIDQYESYGQKIYDIKGVTIPEDYNCFKRSIELQNVDEDILEQYPLSGDKYNQVKKAIDDQYEKQHTSKSFKNRIKNFMKWKSVSVTGHTSWNKDFSKCAWVTFSDDDCSGPKNLQLTVVGWNNKINHGVSSFRVWQDFYFPIFEDNVCPFFDKNGRACFYGYGNDGVTEYSIDLDGGAECRYCPCVVSDTVIHDQEYDWGIFECFTPLLDFPVLLKALLQSKEKRTYEYEGEQSFYKVEFTIPENYQEIGKKHGGLEKFKKTYGGVYMNDFFVTKFDRGW